MPVDDDLPDPLVPAFVDLRGYRGFMLDVDRILASEFLALCSAEEFRAAVLLWCRSWKQIPAGSLPNDERILASFSGIPRLWKKVRAMALRGFVLCSDNRLYHPVLAAEAINGWEKRVAYRNDQERLRKWREDKKKARSETQSETDSETQFETRFNGHSETGHETHSEIAMKRFANGIDRDRDRDRDRETLDSKNKTLPSVVLALHAPEHPPTKAKRKSKVSSVRTQVDPEFYPEVRGCEVFEECGLPDSDLEPLIKRFTDYHRANGTLMADWHAAWAMWCRNEQKYRSQAQSRK